MAATRFGSMKAAREVFVDAARSGVSLEDDFDLIFQKAVQCNLRLCESDVYKALQFAAQDGNLQLVTLLLDKVENHNVIFASDYQEFTDFFRGRDGCMVSSPVVVALKAGHLEVVRKLITYVVQRAGIGSKSSSKDSVTQNSWLNWFQQLVHCAVRCGHASILEFLVLEYQRLFGASHTYDHNIMADALYLAVFHGHLDVMKMILARDISGSIILFQQPRASCSKDGLTALHLAAQCGFVGAVELLVTIEKMDGTEGSSPENFTPLHLAANFGHVEVVNFLLTAVSRITARDCLGRTALHYAAREGHVQVVQALVNAHKDIALVQDDDGLLALHMAARAGHVEVIKALNPFGGIMRQAKHSLEVKSCVEREYNNTLEEGNSCDRRNLTFFSPGKKWRIPRMKLFDSLFWRTEGFTPLHFAARYGYGAAVEELLKNRDAGSTALFIQDSGGFLAYDWMKVQEVQAGSSSSIASARQEEKQATAWQISGGLDVDLNVKLKLLELEKRSSGLSSKITSEIRASIAAHIREEKKAVEELQRSNWHSGNGSCIEDVINRVPIVQWLLEEDDVVDAPWPQVLSSLTVLKPYGFHALDQAFRKANFTAAKHILLHYPGADLRLDAARVSSRSIDACRKYRGEDSLLEDFLNVLVTREELALDAGALSWVAQWAKDHDSTSLLAMIMDRSELKRRLYEDRQLYVDCANAMLVGAALIAGLAFQGWLQPPLGYSYEYQGSEYADVHESAVRAFWWFNNGSFFLAVASLIAGAKGAVPVRHEMDIMRSLEKVRRAVGVASLFLGMAIVCVVGAFSAAGFAVLPPLSSGVQIMRSWVGWGTSLCALALLWFVLGVLPLITETISDLFFVVSIPFVLLVVVWPFVLEFLSDLKRRVLTCIAGVMRNTPLQA